MLYYPWTQKPPLGVPLDPAKSENIVAYYAFNENAGGTAFDLSGNENHGDIDAGDALIDWIPGKFGSALILSPDEVMAAADSPSLSGLSQVSVSIWMRWTTQADAFPLLIGKSNWSDNREYRIRHETGPKIIWQVSNDGNDPGAAEVEFATSLLTVGKWHHVVGTYNGATLWLYLDGVEIDTGAGEAGPLFDGAAPFRIGGFPGGDFWTGALDQPIVWNKCLSSSEVLELFNNPWHLHEPMVIPVPVAAAAPADFVPRVIFIM